MFGNPHTDDEQYLHPGWRRVWGHVQDKMPDHTFGGYPKKRTNLISERAHLGGSRNNLHWVSETPQGRIEMPTARKNDIFFAPR